jgi:hypothetical protein
MGDLNLMDSLHFSTSDGSNAKLSDRLNEVQAKQDCQVKNAELLKQSVTHYI